MHLGSLREFHVFLWFLGDAIQPSSTGSNTKKRSNRDIDAEKAEPQEFLKTPFAVDKDRLDSIFSDMDRSLRSLYEHHRAYKNCSSHTLEEVESRMRDLSLEGQTEPIDKGNRSSPLHGGDDGSVSSISDRGALAHESSEIVKVERGRPHNGLTEDEIDYIKDIRGQVYSKRAPVPLAIRIKELETFVKGAKDLFDFFLPLNYTCSMVTKYWGAIYDMIDVSTGAFNLCMRYSR